MELTCLHCEHQFNGIINVETFDVGDWYSICPKCNRSFEVAVPVGDIIIAFTGISDDKANPYKNFKQKFLGENVRSYYAFNSRKEFLQKWEELVKNPDDMWYWIEEVGIGCITYGGCCEQDIELICDAWGVEAENPYEFNSLLKAAYESCED